MRAKDVIDLGAHMAKVRFRRNVYRCWDFESAKTKQGYHVIKFEGRLQYVHRLLAGLRAGDPRQANHRCPNRWCVFHTYVGTQFDNIQDAIADGTFNTGRRPRGRDHWKVRHPFRTVLAARRLRQEGHTLIEIANRLGVTKATVHKWCRGRQRRFA